MEKSKNNTWELMGFDKIEISAGTTDCSRHSQNVISAHCLGFNCTVTSISSQHQRGRAPSEDRTGWIRLRTIRKYCDENGDNLQKLHTTWHGTKIRRYTLDSTSCPESSLPIIVHFRSSGRNTTSILIFRICIASPCDIFNPTATGNYAEHIYI